MEKKISEKQKTMKLLEEMVDNIGVVRKVTKFHSACIVIEDMTGYKFTIKSELYKPSEVTLD